MSDIAACCRSRSLILLSHLLYDRPTAGPVNLVDTELLLAITITDACVDIVVVKKRTLLGIIVNTLAARAIYEAVGLEHSRTTSFSALHASLVNKATCGAGGPADLDLVLGALCGTIGVKATALADREEEIVVVAILGNVGTFLSVLAIWLEGNVDGCSARSRERRIVHVHAEYVVPEGAKGHDKFGTVPVECAIDGIVVLAGRRGDASATVIGP